ncbi:hypothetical protein [uncultured Allobaculum sp.]|uniref:hypothetical protein n=1 Tax=uncultured Allobaculum sp. TaxID=1187017 RepID=UPI00258C9CEC|nr:hypothetical protein [uncultured Allobaculum sp.]
MMTFQEMIDKKDLSEDFEKVKNATSRIESAAGVLPDLLEGLKMDSRDSDDWLYYNAQRLREAAAVANYISEVLKEASISAVSIGYNFAEIEEEVTR